MSQLLNHCCWNVGSFYALPPAEARPDGYRYRRRAAMHRCGNMSDLPADLSATIFVATHVLTTSSGYLADALSSIMRLGGRAAREHEPAGDRPLFRSAALVYGARTVGVVLRPPQRRRLATFGYQGVRRYGDGPVPARCACRPDASRPARVPRSMRQERRKIGAMPECFASLPALPCATRDRIAPRPAEATFCLAATAAKGV